MHKKKSTVYNTRVRSTWHFVIVMDNLHDDRVPGCSATIIIITDNFASVTMLSTPPWLSFYVVVGYHVTLNKDRSGAITTTV